MAESIDIELRSLRDTEGLGAAIGQDLPAVAVVLLRGEMGSGKTTLAKAICAALDVNPAIVISPTYTLVNIYPGRVPVYHVDLFRIEDSGALLEMDRADWINSAGPTLIEWPDAAMPLLEGELLLDVALTDLDNHPQERRAALSGDGAAFGELFRRLRA